MVYFGSRQFRSPRRGMGGEERGRVLVLGAITAGVIGMVFILRVVLTPGFDDESLPPEPPAAALDVPRPVPPPVPRAPFEEEYALLLAATDGRETPASRLALDYLFQRWLLDVPVEIEAEAPPYLRIPHMATIMRGRRFPLVLELRNDPLLVIGELEGAPRSGLEQYWVVFGLDADNRMHQVRFARKEGFLPRSTVVEVDADFLCIEHYDSRGRGELPIPLWVALELRPLAQQGAAVREAWGPLYVTFGIVLLGLATFGLILWWQSRTVLRRPLTIPERRSTGRPGTGKAPRPAGSARARRGSASGDAPTPGQATGEPPAPGASGEPA